MSSRTRPTGYRWADGTLAADAILPVTYAIENFAKQNDMRGNVVWIRPDTRADIVKAGALLSLGLDGAQKDYGGASITWSFNFLTSLMVQYLRDTFFNSTDWSRANTIRTWNRNNGLWEQYTVTALWPTFEMMGDFDTIGRGYRDFPIRFIKGTKIAP